MLASASFHRERAKLVALALAVIACGPPPLSSDADVESSSEESSSSSSSETGSTGTDSTTTGSTESTDSTETWDFVPEFDMWESNECDPFMQDCPDGEKCVPYASTGGGWDANKCVPVLGDQAPGEPCTYAGAVESTDDCDATSFCWDVQDVDGEWVGTCHLFCTGTPDVPECPEGSTCPLADNGSIALCIPTCDPLLQDCSEGFACWWGNNAFFCIFTTQDIPVGEPCGYINDCAEGLGCLTAEVLPSCAGSACCSPWCELGAGDVPCEALPGTTCMPFFEDRPPPGYENVGVCVLPP